MSFSSLHSSSRSNKETSHSKTGHASSATRLLGSDGDPERRTSSIELSRRSLDFPFGETTTSLRKTKPSFSISQQFLALVKQADCLASKESNCWSMSLEMNSGDVYVGRARPIDSGEFVATNECNRFIAETIAFELIELGTLLTRDFLGVSGTARPSVGANSFFTGWSARKISCRM